MRAFLEELPGDAYILAFVFLCIAIHRTLRYLRRDMELDIGGVSVMGQFGFASVGVASTLQGRDFVAIEYWNEDDEKSQEILLLFTPEQAARLAKLLRIAAAPGRTVAVARALARRER